jgi:HPt (histidine-containing phosphotransfer) domain-containing protein
MYYGYNKKDKMLMADREFIELLGGKSIADINGAIADSIRFQDGKIYITLKDKTIKANFIETILYSTTDEIKMVKLSNIIELKNSTSQIQLNYNPIYLDVTEISNDMGLSVEDYKLYLNSFINQSIVDYDRLLSGEDKAIKNLSTLALTLKIPNLNILLLKIKNLPKEERPHYIDEYYTKLTLLTIRERPIDSKPKSKNDIFEKDILTLDTLNDKEDKLDSKFTELMDNLKVKDEVKPKPKSTSKVKAEDELIDLNLSDDFDDFTLDDSDFLKEKPTPVEKKSKPKKQRDDNNQEIILEDAPPLPIDYNPKIAADELNLPVVLIEEFVEDFIEQAHHDKDHLLASYYQKDMDNIHELGHKLKGAASNLRINQLADVLEEIQFCTDHSKLKGLFIKYWGLFKSLEEYMKQPRQP